MKPSPLSYYLTFFFRRRFGRGNFVFTIWHSKWKASTGLLRATKRKSKEAHGSIVRRMEKDQRRNKTLYDCLSDLSKEYRERDTENNDSYCDTKSRIIATIDPFFSFPFLEWRTVDKIIEIDCFSIRRMLAAPTRRKRRSSTWTALTLTSCSRPIQVRSHSRPRAG